MMIELSHTMKIFHMQQTEKKYPRKLKYLPRQVVDHSILSSIVRRSTASTNNCRLSSSKPATSSFSADRSSTTKKIIIIRHKQKLSFQTTFSATVANHSNTFYHRPDAGSGIFSDMPVLPSSCVSFDQCYSFLFDHDHIHSLH